MHIHVTGDRAFRVACDAYEKAMNIERDKYMKDQINS